MNVYEKKLSDAECEEMLNEMFGTIRICGYEYESGRILKEVDPIAFRAGVVGAPILYCCGQCDTEYPDDKGAAEKCCR